MKEMPLVSVIIPFYSGKKWLEEAIESVIVQEYINKEIIVINDGSKEDIDDLKRKYEKNVNFQNKENGGPASARNLGIELATGKYIAFLDSDDIWLPGKLEKQVKMMEEQNAKWSQHSYEMFWEDSNKTKVVDTSIYKGSVYKDCFISFKIQTSCVMIDRQILIDNNIKFPIDKRYGQDGALYKKIAEKYELCYIPGVLSKFRIRGNNAGFRAIVQINSRADTWKEIKSNKKILEMLPNNVKKAYKICEKESNWIKKKNIKSEKLAKAIYIYPWLIFKKYSKK